MNHWQLFIVVTSLVYMTIACGAYGYLTWKITPMLPFVGSIPAFRGLKDPAKFMKLTCLCMAFGWPVLLSVYAYSELIQWMGKLAGIKWEDLVDMEAIKSAANAGPAKMMNFVVDQGAAVFADNIDKIEVEISFKKKQGGSLFHIFSFETKEKIERVLSEEQPIGEVLQDFLRTIVFGMVTEKQVAQTGKIDAEFEIPPPYVEPPIVQPMTRVPLEDEWSKLEKVDLVRLLYAVANDRATVCASLSYLSTLARDYAEKGAPFEQLEKECNRADAIVDAWGNLVK